MPGVRGRSPVIDFLVSMGYVLLACRSAAVCTLYNPRGRGGRLAVPMDWPGEVKPVSGAGIAGGGEVLSPNNLSPGGEGVRGSWVVVSEPGVRGLVEAHVKGVVEASSPRLIYAVKVYTIPSLEAARILRETGAPLSLPCGRLWRRLPQTLPCGGDPAAASLSS
ncbi:hypothetical protein [Aeropyrum pernix]|uniref:hypothetical protein n=1 Tax=Aeropyrum pernix TaxID=56636 RepID=UPI00130546CE|nr:hypothetical protein [Aeropyrum pernix]